MIGLTISRAACYKPFNSQENNETQFRALSQRGFSKDSSN
jgi:hypothetical protein